MSRACEQYPLAAAASPGSVRRGTCWPVRGRIRWAPAAAAPNAAAADDYASSLTGEVISVSGQYP
ncbi:MAG: hypothetical protein J2P32_01405 [Actinobacteria bacterium]|nr:hypothetical protein [Actinomycetota bacterium]